MLVVCAGGGGVPVVADADGALHGVEAVVDKDLAASLLAIHLDADSLLMLTDVPYVQRDFGTPAAEPIYSATTDQLRRLAFAVGSMGPKVEAAIRFAEATGHSAAIGALPDAVGIVTGVSGTTVTPSRHAAHVVADSY